jgi:predicted Zn-dependent protease
VLGVPIIAGRAGHTREHDCAKEIDRAKVTSYKLLDPAIPVDGLRPIRSSSSVLEPVTDQETELGQAVYNELRDKGEIVESSPLYDSLRPIADAISRVAQFRYPHPFKFFLVHETQPNAFATPGWECLRRGLLALFREEHRAGAGTLYHEVSHTIHQDSMNKLKQEQSIERREIGAAILLGPNVSPNDRNRHARKPELARVLARLQILGRRE